MSALEFVDQPPGRRLSPKRALVQAFADELRANPGKWAAYPWSKDMPAWQARSRASDINHNHKTAPVALRQGFEATYREGCIWVRYIGEDA